ncbi:unnamed protein product [Rotaria socialis]|uniref:Cytochrome b561 domain-containing protein n=1 Tax=Rotaria socialis TaxID=392032 RepID=A0A817XT77_9BILA|nr:unnamed protein product [Rotaria socialis]CAF3653379.1 unnamed protein product [Rotaria socialis]CAF4640745.1 unnamed protein product [Rotaria socialis]CAF4854742.1 unnamed protein product [Rotaria socialis]
MLSVTRRASFLLGYNPLWVFAQLLGLLALILIGILFDKKHTAGGYNWKTSPFNYHPLMMTIGLLFCYGNAILSYRTLTRVPKFTVKLVHACLLVLSLIFALVGLTAIIRVKNESKPPSSHFMSLHAWMGLITIILFVFQWIFGFCCFLFPTLSLEIRQLYMPSHRLWGKTIFSMALITILMGITEAGAFEAFFVGQDANRSVRLMMIFFGLFTAGFGFIVNYLLEKNDFQRPSDPDNDSLNNNNNDKK